MASGTDVINQLRWQIEKIDDDIRRNADAIETCDRQITSVAAQEMVQWPDFLKTQLSENDKALPAAMKNILAERELLLAGARTAADNDGARIKKLESDLDFQVEQKEAIEAELETAEVEAKDAIDADPQSDKIRSDLRVRGQDVAEMELKIATAGVFLQGLKASLKANAILRHLDARGFGTETYHAGFFTRVEERMARATGYYTILGHIASTDTLLQVLHDALRERQGWRDAAMKVAERHTETHFRDVAPIRRRLVEQSERVDAIEQDIERLSASRNEALGTITRISQEDASGSIPALIKVFEKMDLDDVEKLARKTKGGADDAAILSIRIARDTIALHRSEVRDLREKRASLQRQRETLDRAIANVRRNSWHSDRSRFESASAGRLIADLATGLATLDAFESGLRSVRRAPPPPVDTSWTRSSSTSFGSSRSSSTFSTGGGISSPSGFKTGGGF